VSKYKGKEEVEAMIYRGHRLGVCDREGNSVKDSGGVPVARPYKGQATKDLKNVSAEDTALVKFKTGWVPI
jgi:hypothetical protein